MRKLLMTIFALVIVFSSFFPYKAFAAPPDDLVSDMALLMDADTGQVLYDKWMHRRAYPASTTKILTALLVVENTRPYEIVTVSETALDGVEWDSSHIALTPGEQFTVEQGLYALMLPSANDAANALAEHVAGSSEAFARMMTERAHSIGAMDSNFTNPHGLHDSNHYTTAYDMAIITRHAMNNEDFMEYFGAARYTMPATNMNDERPFTNYQYMLVPETYYYNEDVIGGKVGYTHEAQSTMSTIARRDGRTLVAVVMHSNIKSAKFSDTEKLLAFGFDEFYPVTFSYDEYGSLTVPVMDDGKEIGDVFFSTEQNFSALVHQSVSASDLTISYSAPGSYRYNDDISCAISFEAESAPANVPRLLGAIDMDYELVVPTVYTMSLPAGDSHAEGSDKEPFPSRTTKLIGVAAVSVVFIFTAFIIYRRHLVLKRRKQRRQRLERVRREAALYNSAIYSPRPDIGRPPLSAVGRPTMVRTGSAVSQRDSRRRYPRNVYEFPQRKAR